MKSLKPSFSLSVCPISPCRIESPIFKCLHTTSPTKATPYPITTTGPPPSAPIPAASQYGEQINRRRRQAELLKKGQDLRASHMKPGTAMKKRFWKEVHVRKEPDGPHTIHLDTRAVRNPSTAAPLPIPHSKPHLATAIALEWDLLVSAQQALRSHLIPLTSLASRANDISLQDVSPPSTNKTIRSEIIESLLRYLDTDTLLCWAPPPSSVAPSPSLRDLQVRAARPIIAFLTQYVWPGIELVPTLDQGSILPTAQPETTRTVIKGWMAGLPAWELAGLERAVLAGKSLCIAARLVVDWSEKLSIPGSRTKMEMQGNKFGIEDAAEACSLEVRWQTGRWGEVEDSHDVEREDLRRQFGSVILIVGGTGGT